MVWFQCESCGENLKKPKLQNHFRGCAARKLSCIDCGVVFDQQSVQAHTSCVTETEKYGPKGVNKVSNGSAQKPKSANGQHSADLDITIGLSTRPPWACSLCNVAATSYETLEGHSQGKKHRSKAKAAHAKLNPPPPTSEQSVPEANEPAPLKSEETNGSSVPSLEVEKENNKKKRKGDTAEKTMLSENNITNGVDQCVELDTKKKGKKQKSGVEDGKGEDAKDEELVNGVAQPTKAVKWKELITKVLKQAPDGRMKTKKLFEEVLPLVLEMGADASDKKILKAQLLEKLNTCSKFEVDGKVVHLVKTS